MDNHFPGPLLSELLNRVPPEQIYHYTSIAGLHGILSSREVWATMAHYLNDTQEFQHALSIARYQLEIMAGRHALERQPFIRALLEALDGVARVHVCVFSLSEERDLLSQWRGYCPPGGGYSVGLLSGPLCQILARQAFYLGPCIYDLVAQESLMMEVLSPIVLSLPMAKNPSRDEAKTAVVPYLGTFYQRLALVAPFMKHIAFSQEREWRIVTTPIDVHQLSYRLGRTMLIPYFPIRLDSDAIPFPLGTTIVGPTQDQSLAVRALSGFITVTGLAGLGIIPSLTPYRQL